MQISVIGQHLEVPISGLTGALHNQGGRVIRFPTARGPVARSHGIELRFDTDICDESFLIIYCERFSAYHRASLGKGGTRMTI